MTKRIIKTADLDAIYNNLPIETYTKMLKAADMSSGQVYWNVVAKVAKKIGYGAMKMEGAWYPVVNGEINRRSSYQFSTAAAGEAASDGRSRGISFQTSGDWQTIVGI